MTVVLVTALAISTAAACAHREPTLANTTPQHPLPLNDVGASQLVDAIGKAGLPVANRHDVTEATCSEVHCAQAIDTDTVSVLKFPTTGTAQKYAGVTRNSYQVEDLVLVFAPTVTADAEAAYERVAEDAAQT